MISEVEEREGGSKSKEKRGGGGPVTVEVFPPCFLMYAAFNKAHPTYGLKLVQVRPTRGAGARSTSVAADRGRRGDQARGTLSGSSVAGSEPECAAMLALGATPAAAAGAG